MAYTSEKTDLADGQACKFCGRPIRLLGDHESLSLFIFTASLQRRAFRCMNCRQVVCHACRQCGSVCTCRSNAWIAIPYLDCSTASPIEHRCA